MIKNESDQLYVGISKDPEIRLHTHNHKAGAKFTTSGNFGLVFIEEYKSLTEARSREVQIKKWRREKKDILIKMYLSGVKTN